jgi:flagellar hook-associated protein 3 FlgL
VAVELVNAGDVKNNPTATYTDVAGVRTLTLGIDDSDETTLAAMIAAIEGTGLWSVTSDSSAGEGFDGASSVLTANVGVIRGNTGTSGGAAGTLYVNVQAGVTDANQAAVAINAEGTFSAEVDPHDNAAGPQLGIGPVDLSATATTSGGNGSSLDIDAGIQVTNGGQVHQISFVGADSVEDLLNVLNGSAAGLLAEINTTGTGIDLRSRLSGSDFAIGENGGTTATQLGLRTLATTTALNGINKGRGVNTVDGPDFTVVRNDGVRLDIDVSNAESIGAVIDLINGHPDNQDTAAVVARLTEFGNGIELVDDNPSGVDAEGQPNRLQVVRVASSHAAIDLGLVPAGQGQGDATQGATAPTAAVWLSGANTDLTLTAAAAGTALGGVRVELVNNVAVGDQALVTYDAASQTLQIDVDPTTTQATTVVDAVNTEGTFLAELNTTNGPNDGSGLVIDTGVVATLSSGSPEVLTGVDVNLQETEGALNTLLQLQAAVRSNDLPNIRRALGMLENDIARVNFTRAEIGVRQQGLGSVENRLQDEKIELEQALSDEIDVDLAAAISELTARQFSFQASLQASAKTLQLTLLDFL